MPIQYGARRAPGSFIPSFFEANLFAQADPQVTNLIASLTNGIDYVRDQKDSSACVGYALSSGLHIAANGAGAHPSPRCLWVGARSIERDRMHAPLMNVGCDPYDAAQWAMTRGIFAQDDTDYNATYYDTELDAEEVASLVRCPVGAFQAIPPSDPLLDSLDKALTAGFPVAFAMDVDESYETYDGSAVWPGPTGSSLGGHEQLIVGYADDYYLVLNSWGTAWGRGGFCMFSKMAMSSVSWSHLVVRGGITL